jgi:hypothetical protein
VVVRLPGSGPGSGSGTGSTGLVERVAPVVAATLDGAPVPLVTGGSSVTVLLPLVDPAGVATVFSALRAEFDTPAVTRRTMSIDALAALGPLSGRLSPGPAGMG